MNHLPKITFIALETYSMIGGLQKFNQRVIDALNVLFVNKSIGHVNVLLKGDKNENINILSKDISIKTFPNSKLKFILQTLHEITDSNVLFIGHVNLLPIAFLSKIRNPKLKIVLFVHGEDVWNTEHARQMKLWEPFLARSLDQVASVSAFTAGRMSRAFKIPKEKFIVFPNAVDHLLTGPMNLEKKPLLLTVARLAKHDWGKHHDSVLKAMPLVLEKYPSVRYNIIGDGVLRPKLEELVDKLNINHAVNFMGRVSDEELASSYAQSSVFVMPSEKEGFGIVFLEAWLRKIPVICGTDDASHEVVSHGLDGFAINHNDIELLAEKIIYLIENPVISKNMGNSGYNKVMNNYLMEHFINNLAKIIEEIKYD